MVSYNHLPIFNNALNNLKPKIYHDLSHQYYFLFLLVYIFYIIQHFILIRFYVNDGLKRVLCSPIHTVIHHLIIGECVVKGWRLSINSGILFIQYILFDLIVLGYFFF
jgi:hypothetical protein